MNIPGIEILNKTEIIETSLNNVSVSITLVLFLFGLIFLLFAIATDEDVFGFMGLTLFALSLLMFILSFVFPNKVPTGRYEYEVYICDDANVVQLYKDYEYVESRGDIYIFRDPEEKEDADFCCDCGKHTSKNTECAHNNNASSECMKKHNCKEQPKELVEQEDEVVSVKENVTPVDNICSNCNSTLEENDKFCSQCGSERKEK